MVRGAEAAIKHSANRALRREEAGKTRLTGGKLFVRRILPVLAVAAACLVLVLAGLNGGSGASFGSVRLNRLPVAGVSRGEDARETDFEAAFGCTAESLFPGWDVAEARTVAAGGVSEAVLTLRKAGGDTALEAEVTGTEPPLYTALADKARGSDPVRLNLDPDTGVRYAVIRHGALYVTLSSADMAEDDFVRTVRGIAGAWNTGNAK